MECEIRAKKGRSMPTKQNDRRKTSKLMVASSHRQKGVIELLSDLNKENPVKFKKDGGGFSVVPSRNKHHADRLKLSLSLPGLCWRTRRTTGVPA